MRIHAASLAVVFVISGCSQLMPQGSSNRAALPAAKVHPGTAYGTLTTLYSFQGQPDGAVPQGPALLENYCCPYVIRGNTSSGGANNAGTIYTLTGTLGSSFTESYLFSYSPSVSGSDPTGPVAGRLTRRFVTAARGGSYNKGTLIELPEDGGGRTKVHSFDGADGAKPEAVTSFSFDDDLGMYIVTTYSGGRYHRGAIVGFLDRRSPRINPKLLYSFSGKGDGEHPNSALSPGGYGTTAGSNGGGETIFQFVPDKGISTIFTFNSPQDGVTPTGVLGAFTSYYGGLFGTTVRGGSSGDGVLYEITRSGSSYSEKILHNFAGAGADGAYPQGTLVGGNKFFYGVTEKGGSSGCGTIFRVDLRRGKYQVVYSFTCGNDGAMPKAGFMNNPWGVFIGTTSAGGTANKGVVFEFAPSS